jgi:hypothetical protein
MIFKVDIKSMPKYGYERNLGLRCKLLGGLKQNCGCYCRSLQRKNILWALPLDLNNKTTLNLI